MAKAQMLFCTTSLSGRRTFLPEKMRLLCNERFAYKSPSLLYTFVVNIVAVAGCFLSHCCFQ